MRARLSAALALDQRLARIVSATTEPMLGQMRLAWWRDMLALRTPDRPAGDAALSAIGAHWSGDEQALIDVVDGWEVLLVSVALADADLVRIARGRGAPFVALFGGASLRSAARVSAAATRFVCADLAIRLSDAEERRRAIRLGLDQTDDGERLPREARGLRVLEALALRALERGGKPLMEGRGAALTALKAGFFGR
ncbi:hypothetical protein [Erythrobacter sp. JK5]|uniref:hypothetical protein n=1 Tax=Erythrobacter sp. JK5 TaxID=2829500 RepID=UPI001BAC7CBD|nr:hypothetical protein [Erythrobacter sp. JK5]QUL38674.1 hypothetical protein KDC96_04615 [Erythrobacter sp. JK5]